MRMIKVKYVFGKWSLDTAHLADALASYSTSQGRKCDQHLTQCAESNVECPQCFPPIIGGSGGFSVAHPLIVFYHLRCAARVSCYFNVNNRARSACLRLALDTADSIPNICVHLCVFF